MNKDILLLMLLKEVKSASRNRNLTLLILLVPLLLFPILILVPPILANPPLTPSPVLVINLDNGAQGSNLTRQISQAPGLTITTGGANIDPQAAVKSGIYDAAIVIPPNFTSMIAQNQTAPVQLYFDATYSRSTVAVGLLNAVLLSYSQQIVTVRNSGKSAFVPIGVTPTPLAGVRPLLATVSFIFPTLWVAWAAVAGAYLALDITATEESESVLTSLLASPHTRFEVMTGKVFFLAVSAIFVATLTIVGVYVVPTLGVFIGSRFRDLIVVSSIPLTASSIGTVALGVGLTFALSCFIFQFLSIFLMGAGRAKIALTGILGGAASTVFLLSTSGSNFSGGMILPYIGAYTLLSRVVLGTATIADVGIVALDSIVLGVVFLLLAYHEFAGEGILLRTAFAAPKEPAVEEAPVEEESSMPPSLSEKT